MIKCSINQQAIEVLPHTTVLQACELLGLEIPHFCYHPRLPLAGNCRMCLVEMEGLEKPIVSCATIVAEGMVIYTNTPKVKAAHQGVLEFLLINHPLDCPVCDQGGECDLQDLSVGYGRDIGRFAVEKRAVVDKEMGPLIKTFMNRCIHCTRCIRFATEIAGVPELGALGRGEDMEITSYLEQSLTSELSGNLIDICPVGALTSKPYAFRARPWELVHTHTIDVLDAVGSHIRVDSRGQEIMRILPREAEAINEAWISDKTRFAFDGLQYQRLDTPYVRKRGKLKPVSWDEAFAYIKTRLVGLGGHEIAAVAGDLVDCEAMLALKDLMERLQSPHLDCRQDGTILDPLYRWSYLFNTTIAGIEKADACLLIASNPRHEAAMVNARLHKRYRQGNFPVGLIGPQVDLTYPYEYLGDNTSVLHEIAGHRHPFAQTLATAHKPMLILGQSALNRSDSGQILLLAEKIAKDTGMFTPEWQGFNVLHHAAARVGGLDLGFTPQSNGYGVKEIIKEAQNGTIKALYLLGADELSLGDVGQSLVIYQGHHGDRGVERADVILPGCAYSEKSATYVNTEGRPQRTNRVLFPPGEAQEDWAIIRALSVVLGLPLPYDNLNDLRHRLGEVNSLFTALHKITPAPWEAFPQSAGHYLSPAPFASAVENFYMTDPISRHSPVMAQCTKVTSNVNKTC